MTSVPEQLVNVLREVAHPDIGVIERVRSANDSLLRSMTTRAQQMDDLLGRLESRFGRFGCLSLPVLLWHWDSRWVHGLPTCDKERQKHQVPLSHNRYQRRKLLGSKSFRNGTQSIIELGLGRQGVHKKRAEHISSIE